MLAIAQTSPGLAAPASICVLGHLAMPMAKGAKLITSC